MPIRIPDGLPARETLVREGVQVLDESIATRQDIRPMQIGLLNLMPNKIETEAQIARLVGATPLQVELTASATPIEPATRLDVARNSRPAPLSPPSFSMRAVEQNLESRDMSELRPGWICIG